MKRKVYAIVNKHHVWEEASKGWTLFETLRRFHFGEGIHDLLMSYKDPVDQEITVVRELSHANIQKAIKAYTHPDCGLRLIISIADCEELLGKEDGFWIKELKIY